MKKIILLFSFLILFFNTFSQNNSKSEKVVLYTFEQSSETYQAINQTGTKIIPNDWDDGCTTPTNIGFDFNYNGIIFSQFTVNTNGTVNLGTQIVTKETNDLASAQYFNLLTPLWDDLKFKNLGVDEGIFYLLEGIAGEQILTIEFYNIERYSNSGTGTGKANFQVKLFETDNHVEFIYGDMSTTATWDAAASISVGINSQISSNTVFWSVTPNSLTGATASSTVANNEISTSIISSIATGTVYKFTPPAIANDLDISISSLNSPKNGFLNANQKINITLLNLGTNITSGLNLNCKIIDIKTNTTKYEFSEDYNIFGTYPIISGSSNNFEFPTIVDLSENSNYKITITANLTNDIDILNNTLIQTIKGVVIGNIIFTNAQLITHPNSGFENADVSAVQQDLGMVYYGDNASNLIGYRNADDFTVLEGQTWKITGLGFYNFQTGSTTESTITYADFKIWDNNPLVGNLVADSTQNNMLSGTKWSNIYRAASLDLLNNQRPIMHNICNFDAENFITLTSGTYWLDYSCEGTLLSGPYQPYITILGQSQTGNAMHFGADGWVPMIDNLVTDTQGMPMEIYGEIVLNNNEINENKFVIYPNPCNRNFNIKTNFQNYDINIYNIIGKKVFSSIKNNQNINININNLESGVYFVEINYLNNNLTQKLIVR